MKKLWIAAAIGALLGASLTEVFHRVTDKRSRERFEMNLRCKRLADEFVSKASNDYRQVMLNEVHFSAARNACIASVDEASHVPSTATMWRYTVVDVASGETIFDGICNDDKESAMYCGDGRNMEIIRKRNGSFEETVH
jgi:hypothetical protein